MIAAILAAGILSNSPVGVGVPTFVAEASCATLRGVHVELLRFAVDGRTVAVVCPIGNHDLLVRRDATAEELADVMAMVLGDVPVPNWPDVAGKLTGDAIDTDLRAQDITGAQFDFYHSNWRPK